MELKWKGNILARKSDWSSLVSSDHGRVRFHVAFKEIKFWLIHFYTSISMCKKNISYHLYKMLDIIL